jgi:oxygen-independent coproporphyrinogen-3 oxidase
MSTVQPEQPSPFSEALLRRFEGPGPRYTSYPTADRFVEAFGHAQHQAALDQRRGTGAQRAGPLSVYVHIPFCESVCYYCACNKIITRRREQAGPYLASLVRELDLLGPHLGARPEYSQLHLGGGSPTFLSDDELQGLMGELDTRFLRRPGAEVSIEVDPRTVSETRLARLRSMGFNRLSFGVQDFDADVQRAVHRVQSAADVQSLVAQARALGFASTNVDLIYGLPKQTQASFDRTIEQVCELRPERIALYAYAHLPQRFKPQRRIHDADLPPPADKLGMLAQAIRGFEAAGYEYIGMDHFALPGDALAVAKRQGRLQRNFQGYSTQADCDLIGLGVSAISRLGASYSQNAKTLDEYEAALKAGHLPVARGLTMSRDDLVRRAVIMGLMCQGRVEFESIELAHLISFTRYFHAELAALESFEQAGLVSLESGAIQVSPPGWYFVRAVAMVFDHYVQQDLSRQRFSRLI